MNVPPEGPELDVLIDELIAKKYGSCSREVYEAAHFGFRAALKHLMTLSLDSYNEKDFHPLLLEYIKENGSPPGNVKKWVHQVVSSAWASRIKVKDDLIESIKRNLDAALLYNRNLSRNANAEIKARDNKLAQLSEAVRPAVTQQGKKTVCFLIKNGGTNAPFLIMAICYPDDVEKMLQQFPGVDYVMAGWQVDRTPPKGPA